MYIIIAINTFLFSRYAREQEHPKVGSSDTSEEVNENDENLSQPEAENKTPPLSEKGKCDNIFGSQSSFNSMNTNNNLSKRNHILISPAKPTHQLTIRTVDSLNKITPLEEIVISDSEET